MHPAVTLVVAGFCLVFVGATNEYQNNLNKVVVDLEYAPQPGEEYQPEPKTEDYATPVKQDLSVDQYNTHTLDTYDGSSKLLYRGMYPGKCDLDGFYYKTEYSFVMCSNGYEHEQRCALGSKNSGYQAYSDGAGYYLHDFCDVNLVDLGFNIPVKKPGYKVVSLHEVVTKNEGYEPRKVPAQGLSYEKKQVVSSGGPHGYELTVYQGVYKGKCIKDGFYYNNEDSFVMCSNGYPYVQRCAPGSKNSGLAYLQHGGLYDSFDFCDVNLVDYGYPGYHGYPVKGVYHPYPRFPVKSFGHYY